MHNSPLLCACVQYIGGVWTADRHWEKWWQVTTVLGKWLFLGLTHVRGQLQAKCRGRASVGFRGHSRKFAHLLRSRYFRELQTASGSMDRSRVSFSSLPSPPCLCLTALCKCYGGTTGVNLCPRLQRSKKRESGELIMSLVLWVFWTQPTGNFFAYFDCWKCADTFKFGKRCTVILFTYCK